MKQLVLSGIICLAIFSSCKKNSDETTPTATLFPKTLRESQRLLEFKVWVKGVDISTKVNPKSIFEYDDWVSPVPKITLLNNNQYMFEGVTDTFGYFFYQGAMFMVDVEDTFPFPIAFGNYDQIEFYDYRIKLTSDGSSSGRSVFEKATKATLEEEADFLKWTKIDTMAYINRSLIFR